MDEGQPVYLWLCFVTKQILFWRRQLTTHYAADKALPDNDEREETADKTLPDNNEGKMGQWGKYGGKETADKTLPGNDERKEAADEAADQDAAAHHVEGCRQPAGQAVQVSWQS